VRVGTGVAGKAQLVTLGLVLVLVLERAVLSRRMWYSGRWDVPRSRLLAALSSNSGFVSSALSVRTCNGVKRLPSRRCGQAIASKRTASQIENEDEYAERRTRNAERQTPNAKRQTPNGERETVKELENRASCRYVE
jgi:hypothetical protein